MNTRLIVAKNKVNDWLIGEHDYQFGKNQITHKADPVKSIAYILNTEIGNKWNRFQFYDHAARTSLDTNVVAQAAQQLLKACGAARGALVWEHVAAGETIEQGDSASRHILQAYFGNLTEATDLPDKTLLTEPLDVALSNIDSSDDPSLFKSMPVFTQLAGLAVSYSLDQQERFGQMIIPQPGVASGEIRL